MIMDKKGKLFGKISIIDLIIVVVIIGGILGGLGYKYSKSNTPGVFVKNDDVEITFYVEEAPDFTAKAVKPGAIFKESIQDVVFGQVKSADAIKIDKPVSYAANDKGEIIRSSTKEGYVSLYVTVEGKAIYSDNGITINSVPYYIGQNLTNLRMGAGTISYTKIFDIKKK